MAAQKIRPPDDLDLRIIAFLRADARTANKQIAQALGVAESTVAARIRSLSERGLMRVVLLQDIRALGYDLLAHIDIHLDRRSAHDVAAELVDMDQVAMVSVFPNPPEIIIQINASDRHDFSRFLTETLASVKGIRSVETSISLEIVKYVSEFGVLKPS